ncbi:riboflavin biosynthesis protein RibD [Iamia sp. SCSIO 61187]|uniref:dihydrofolate reductase family protein n=1 Tax=Iamia sp. SCSIO 61187 TaxID=2722752 RepID=UPI001C62CA9E|nr:dihydrofolate reductase family protein [Iamia sp. SCSIO 61187]QYG92960.1 riboflavin biosynthesis protein RibD [Iamia sp. SCSIO 61187]
MPRTPARTVVANITLSLDGRINGPDGEHDMGWIVPHALSDGARDHMLRVTEPATTVLLGRKNYSGFGEFWPSVASMELADPRDRAFSRWLDATDKVVFSSTLTDTPWRGSRLATAGPAATVAELREGAGGDIVVLASVSIIRQLLEADLVDRLSIMLCPVVVGGGDRLFDATTPASDWTPAGSWPTETGATALLLDRTRTA